MSEKPHIEGKKFLVEKLSEEQIRVGKRDGIQIVYFKPFSVKGTPEEYSNTLLSTLKKHNFIDDDETEGFKDAFTQLMSAPIPATEEELVNDIKETLEPQKPETTPPVVPTAPVAPVKPPTPTPPTPAESQAELLKQLKKDYELLPNDRKEYLQYLARNYYHCSIDELMLKYAEQADKMSVATYWLALFGQEAKSRNAPFLQKQDEYCYHTWFVDAEGNLFDTTVPSNVTDLKVDYIYQIPEMNIAARCIARSENVRKVETVLMESTVKLTQIPIPTGKTDVSTVPSTKEVMTQLMERMYAVYTELEKADKPETKNHSKYACVNGTITEITGPHEKGERKLYWLTIDDFTLRPPVWRKAFRVPVTFDKGHNFFVESEAHLKNSEGKLITVFGYFQWKPAVGTWKPQMGISPEYLVIGA